MTDKQLKRLNRSKLLQMLLEIERENEALRARNELLEQQMKQSGSIAEAALKLSGIFEAAQQAADQYVYNVQRQAAPPKGGTRDA